MYGGLEVSQDDGEIVYNTEMIIYTMMPAEHPVDVQEGGAWECRHSTCVLFDSETKTAREELSRGK